LTLRLSDSRRGADTSSPRGGDDEGVNRIKLNTRLALRLLGRMERVARKRGDTVTAERVRAAIDSTKAGEAAAAIGGILAFFGAFGILFVPVTSVPVLDWEFLLIVGAIVFALGLVMEASD
jgi:hypothetical protein